MPATTCPAVSGLTARGGRVGVPRCRCDDRENDEAGDADDHGVDEERQEPFPPGCQRLVQHLIDAHAGIPGVRDRRHAHSGRWAVARRWAVPLRVVRRGGGRTTTGRSPIANGPGPARSPLVAKPPLRLSGCRDCLSTTAGWRWGIPPAVGRDPPTRSLAHVRHGTSFAIITGSSGTKARPSTRSRRPGSLVLFRSAWCLPVQPWLCTHADAATPDDRTQSLGTTLTPPDVLK